MSFLSKLFGKVEPTKNVENTTTPKKSKRSSRKKEDTLSEKEKATHNDEPYIAILKVDIDPNNINAGAFELDWNDKFILNLIRAGYKQKEEDTDQIIVDRWFQTVCRNVALEMYEQKVADPKNRDSDDLRRVQTRNIGNGRTEIS